MISTVESVKNANRYLYSKGIRVSLSEYVIVKGMPLSQDLINELQKERTRISIQNWKNKMRLYVR